MNVAGASLGFDIGRQDAEGEGYAVSAWAEILPSGQLLEPTGAFRCISVHYE